MKDGTYKITFNGYKIGEAGQVVSWSDPNAFHTITLLTDGHGSIQSTSLTGRPGDVVTLSTEYSSYYRFDNYGLTGGGSLDGNTYTFGYEDATIQANFKPNAFTAKGLWEHGSNTTAYNKYGDTRTTAIPLHYAYLTAHTGDIPTSWYSTNNRWNPSNANDYNAFLNPKAKAQLKLEYAGGTTAYFCTRVGSTNTEGQTFNSVGTHTYDKSFTTTTQANYAISGYLRMQGLYNGNYWYAAGTAFADGYTGTWSATGIAP